MRQIRFLLTCLLISTVVACEETLTETPSAQGSLAFSMKAVDTHNPRMKSENDAVLPDVDDFTVELFDSKGMRFYRDSYRNTSGKTIALDVGNYTLLAYHGNPLGIGWDAAYYEARESFDISAQEVRGVEATAKMANVKVAVVFGKDLLRDYTNVYCIARSGQSGVKGALTFEPENDKAGYMPAGDVLIELYATMDGMEKYFRFPAQHCDPNDFATFRVNSESKGEMAVEITIDDSVEEIVIEETVSESALPQNPPVVTPRGFADNEGRHEFEFVEAMEYQGTQIDILAMGDGIKSAVLDFGDNAASLGFPMKSVDLVSADKEMTDRLSALGIDWVRQMEGARIACIDFSNMGNCCKYNPDNVFNAPFTLTVTDKRGKSSESMGFVLRQIPASFTVNAHDWNAFARRIVGITADVAAGNPSLVALQYADGAEGPWTDVPHASVSGSSVSYEDITGLASGTPYYIRALYNGNEFNATEPVMLTTEQKLQVGNAGFEEWTTEIFEYTAFYKKKTCDWYLPRTVDSWWAVNSKKTMRSYCEGDAFGIGANYNLKVFPTVSYFDNGNGFSVQLATIATGKAATNDGPGTVEVSVAAGEIWIGKATEGDFVTGGNHASDGHAFSSRPSAVAFKYQYIPENNENFYCYVELKDADGNKLFAKEIVDGPAENTGKTMTIPVTYADYTKKAASIYMCFKSSSASSPSYSKKEIIMPNGSQTACVGSILRIDDIQLIYE